MNLFFGGGLNERDELNVTLEECIEGQNYLLDAQARTFRPRPPFDLKGTATNAQPISGIAQLIKRNDADTTLVFAGGQVYSVSDAYAFTDVGDITTSTGIRSSYWSLDDKLVITDKDKANPIHEWDGSVFQRNKHGIGNGTATTANGFIGVGTNLHVTHANSLSEGQLVTISNASPDAWNGEWYVDSASSNGFQVTIDSSSTTATGSIAFEPSVELYAKYSLVWRGRVWLFNITTDSTENPHMVLASQFENTDIFDSTQRADPNTSGGLSGSEAFFMLSPDLRPINGAALFYDTIVISTVDGKLFKITGSDASDYQVVDYYPGSAATGSESIVNTGNDVMWMKKGGNIDRLSSVETYGDVKADDISRFIPDETKGISDSIAVYDEQRQKIMWFVSGKVIVLDKNMLSEQPALSPWTIYKTNHTSGFVTNVATYMRDLGGTTYDVYFGDSSGNIYKLNGTEGNGDAGSNTVLTRRKFRFMGDQDFEENRFYQTQFENITGRIEYRRRGVANITMKVDWGEEGAVSEISVPLKGLVATPDANFWGGSSYWSGTAYWSAGSAPTNKISTKGFSPAGKGRGFFLELSSDTKVDFLINRLIL